MIAYALAPRPRVATRLLGDDAEPLVAIDGLSADATTLVDFAVTDGAFAPAHGPAGGYPGIRSPAPLDYVGTVVRALTPLIAESFGLGEVRPVRAECFLSLVTLPPDRLVPSQRAPHVDTTDPLQFALLHYLCGAEFGGTAFFRHRATGYEAVTADRAPAYQAARTGEAEAATGYQTGDDAWFEEIGRIDAAFDRIAIYRSRLLHSGVIAAPERLSPDARRGRLTANIFLQLRDD